MAKKKKKELKYKTDKVLELHNHVSEIIPLIHNVLAKEMTKRFKKDDRIKYIATARVLNYVYANFYQLGIRYGSEQLAKAENENV